MSLSPKAGDFVIWWRRGLEPCGARVCKLTAKRVGIVKALVRDDAIALERKTGQYVRREHLSLPGFTPEHSDGGGAYDPIGELPYMIADTLTEYSQLRCMWVALLRRSVQVGLSYDRWGSHDCFIRIEDEVGNYHEFHRAAGEATAAISGCIREAYSSVTAKALPFDSKAYFNDFEME